MNTNFAKVLRSARERKGMTQQQMASKLYVNRSSVSNWESGRRLPDAELLVRISKLLGIDVELLLTDGASVDEPQRVMVVDDETIILRGEIQELRRALPDAEVTGFAAPSEAVAYVRKNKVSLAFLDIEMGSVSGLDLCRKLLDIDSRIQIVFLTAFPDYARDAWATTASGFLVKPITPETIAPLLERLHVIRGG